MASRVSSKTCVQVMLIDPPGSSLFNKVKRGVLYTRHEAEGKRLKNPFDTITEGIGINRITANFSCAKVLHAPCMPTSTRVTVLLQQIFEFEDKASWCYISALQNSLSEWTMRQRRRSSDWLPVSNAIMWRLMSLDAVCRLMVVFSDGQHLLHKKALCVGSAATTKCLKALETLAAACTAYR